MSVMEKNLRYIRSVTGSPNKDICIANAAVCTAEAKNFVIDLINKKDSTISIKETGYLYEDKEVVPNNEAGVSDVHKIRIGYTTFGFSIICSSKLWFVLSQEDIGEAIAQYKSKTAQRYGSDFQNWLAGLLEGNSKDIINAYAGAITHGAKDSKDELFGVIDNMDRREGVSTIYIDGAGDKSMNITTVPAVTLCAVHSGSNYYLQVEMVLTISAVYSDGKPIEQKADKK